MTICISLAPRSIWWQDMHCTIESLRSLNMQGRISLSICRACHTIYSRSSSRSKMKGDPGWWGGSWGLWWQWRWWRWWWWWWQWLWMWWWRWWWWCWWSNLWETDVRRAVSSSLRLRWQPDSTLSWSSLKVGPWYFDATVLKVGWYLIPYFNRLNMWFCPAGQDTSCYIQPLSNGDSRKYLWYNTDRLEILFIHFWPPLLVISAGITQQSYCKFW